MKFSKSWCSIVFLTLSVGFSSFGKKYPALKVESFRQLDYIVEDVPANIVGLTSADIKRAVRLKLLGTGIKPTDIEENNRAGRLGAKHFIYVSVNMSGVSYNIDVSFIKWSKDYRVSSDIAGSFFKPRQGAYSYIGTTSRSAEGKAFVMNAINKSLEQFLLDYLESNVQ